MEGRKAALQGGVKICLNIIATVRRRNGKSERRGENHPGEKRIKEKDRRDKDFLFREHSQIHKKYQTHYGSVTVFPVYK